MISETEIVSVRSSYSSSSGSIGGSGVDVPVLKGVEVPDTLGVACLLGILGTIMVILKETSPDSPATGFAEYFALSISIVSYLK